MHPGLRTKTLIPQAPHFRPALITAAVLLALAGAAQAQVSTSTVKGQVSGSSAAGAAVTAVNKDTGATYRTSARADGSYVLVGLAPGRYRIQAAGGTGVDEVTLQVAESATVDLTAGAQSITITGTAQRQGVRDSQVGTAVHRRMIETMPQGTRNFLSSADLAPGVEFTSNSRSGYTGLQAGAQNFDHVGVFIDGVNQKNNILRGGVSGQDSTRGNPFPQSAIAEYRVISSNYKAEFDQVSSVAITAITRSGGNQFHGDAYIDRTGTNWSEKTPFEEENEAAGVPRPPSKKQEYGFSVGGPIKADALHFFVGFDGKNIEDSRQYVPQRRDLLPSAGIVPALLAGAGNQVNKFEQQLLFGKLDAQLSSDQRLSLSFRVRSEDDEVAEDKKLSTPANIKQRANDETRVDLKHEWTMGDWFSEARLGMEDARWNPHSSSNSPMFRYKVALNPAEQRLSAGITDVAIDGGSPDAQDRRQKGFFVSEDLSYTGLKGHSLKGGVKLKAMKYELGGTSRSVNVVETLIDRTTGLPYFSNGLCTGTNISNSGLSSDQCRMDLALQAVSVNFSNNQIGLYLQDDWAITRQLELNIGLRWDYETNMLNNDYVTPADRVTALRGLDGRTIAGITAPATQTYAQSLAKGGVNIEDYIANGGRKAYKGALAPRIGASFDISGDRRTVVFGGFGRSYDRTMANHALDELQKNKQAGGEIWLINNDVKLPYADQISVGLRQAVGSWNVEAVLQQVHAKNQFVWYGGNRDPNGGWGTQSPIDPLWGGPNGFGTLILGDFVGEDKTNSLQLKAEKPYSNSTGWGLTAAYTYSDAKTLHKEWNNDIFDWTYGRSAVRGFNPSTLVDKHRLVVGGVMDGLLPWGFTLSGKATWASGKPRRITSCAAGWDKCVSVEGPAPNFTQIDLGLSKEVLKLGQHALTLRVDVLNALGKVNYGGLDDWGGGPGNPQNFVGGDNANLGKPNDTRGDTRTFRLMVGYKF